ncbi:ABC transporter ATP-binding protein [Mesorhizobium sp. BAC0120]|uniref:ABC transporter ATP-binding protein n=1 Tax=Mesorhizobium sp. BAC0120 TaxID=3090670 RepID=UPI00298C98C5|nr:ABC transporter ATP-binding protein [Mesorhizobium sp. BAC0120]MDW6022459.1 ABC transporter ATP-binding protein [Mesorhizobium sp. BAC0120]
MAAAVSLPGEQTGFDQSVRLGALNVTRRFGALVANDDITFRAERGKVHAIVGGNGAGKSTLMRILQGMDRPDQGVVVVDGLPAVFLGPADAFACGIGMVHQEFMLVPGLTLLENLVLAHEPVDAIGRIDKAKAREEAQRLERLAGVKLDWDTPEQDAPVHVRQIVEILRLLYRGADVLILDEPTAVLAPAQVKQLIALLRKLSADGRTILFISHKLEEVLAVADQITVIRNGKVVGSLPREEATKAKLAEMMIGEILSWPTARAGTAGRPVLEISGLSASGKRGHAGLSAFDLTVRAGEIVGIAGVAGNGQDELAAAITGLGRVDSGAIWLDGKNISTLTLRERRALGLSYLSPDRAAEGLCLAAPIAENAIAGHHRRPDLSTRGILRRRAIARHVGSLLDRYSVRRASDWLPAASLSGGNQQRVAVARELDGNPKFLLACQPTRGVDIRGIAFIHQCLLDFRDRGGAVLLISEELEELIGLSDRIVVVYGGRITGEVARGSARLDEIGRLMLGGSNA